jgi:hypothetical protein
LARRANALALLDQGMSCSAVAKVLFLDDDTIPTWYCLYQEDGFDGLVSFGYDGSACRPPVNSVCLPEGVWMESFRPTRAEPRLPEQSKDTMER